VIVGPSELVHEEKESKAAQPQQDNTMAQLNRLTLFYDKNAMTGTPGDDGPPQEGSDVSSVVVPFHEDDFTAIQGPLPTLHQRNCDVNDNDDEIVAVSDPVLVITAQIPLALLSVCVIVAEVLMIVYLWSAVGDATCRVDFTLRWGLALAVDVVIFESAHLAIVAAFWWTQGLHDPFLAPTLRRRMGWLGRPSLHPFDFQWRDAEQT